MSGLTLQPDLAARTDEPEGDGPPSTGADASMLVDKFPPWLMSTRRLAGVTLVCGLVYAFLSIQPIWHTDIWGHLAYGRVVWNSGHIPATEPLMPLAKGMPFVDTAWLSQLAFLGVWNALGGEGLRGVTGLLAAACVGLWWRGLWPRTRNLFWGTAGSLLVLYFLWNELIVLRPQLFGLVAFLAAFTLWRTRLDRLVHWIALPVVYALWANVHGSFVVGLAMGGVFVAGRAIDVLRRTGQPRALLRDRPLRRLFLVWELCVAAVLLNPYGYGLIPAVYEISRNVNLQSLTEWQTIYLRDLRGWAILGTLGALGVVYRLTPRRVAAWEVLMLFGLTAAMFGSARLLAAWAPVACYLLVLHGHAAWKHARRGEPAAEPLLASGKWTVVAVGLAWIAFGYSPLGVRVLHGRAAPIHKSLSPHTPVAAVAYLKEHPPVGQVFNIYEWGDYLQWAGPPDVRIFVNSHAHVVPQDVWQHYLDVINGSSAWSETLDRYGVNTVLLDTQYRSGLIARLKDDRRWRLDFEDPTAAVFTRRVPIDR